MPSGRNDETYMRMLTAEEAENRRAYLAAHPGVDELSVAPNVSGYAPVADWAAAGSPGAAECRCPVHAQG
jgi:hypothetical protein